MSIFTKKRHNILILGCNGMLGKELTEYFKRISSSKNSDINVITALDYPDVDITDIDNLNVQISNSVKYDYIINCAAITDTKGIENNLKIRSYEVNALACRNLARVCKIHKIKLIHISTDYVFSELSGRGPFDIDCDPIPVNTYGMHKLLGEQFIQSEMKSHEYAIIRVSWLYGKYNEKSFIHKFLKNCAIKMNDGIYDITCTEDEYSVPTNCTALCHRIYATIRHNLFGILHGNDKRDVDESHVSRLDFCNEILKNLKSMYPDNIHIQKLRCVGMKMNINGEMRYPKNSTLVPTSFEEYKADENLPFKYCDWRSLLNIFMTYDSNIKDWFNSVLSGMSNNP